MAIGPAKLEINPYRLSAVSRSEPIVALVLIVRETQRWCFERTERRRKGATKSKEENNQTLFGWQLGCGPRLNLSHTIFIKNTLYMININERCQFGSLR
jgi:hypothetical protein